MLTLGGLDLKPLRWHYRVAQWMLRLWMATGILFLSYLAVVLAWLALPGEFRPALEYAGWFSRNIPALTSELAVLLFQLVLVTLPVTRAALGAEDWSWRRHVREFFFDATVVRFLIAYAGILAGGTAVKVLSDWTVFVVAGPLFVIALLAMREMQLQLRSVTPPKRGDLIIADDAVPGYKAPADFRDMCGFSWMRPEDIRSLWVARDYSQAAFSSFMTRCALCAGSTAANALMFHALSGHVFDRGIGGASSLVVIILLASPALVLAASVPRYLDLSRRYRIRAEELEDERA
ncbi:hypothetical protein [Antrihabitans cavernicola]|uniref:Uncharacterized protein n=1 Tax=Antrihabitans cavernicola TaxID=2495913 RepID=A0A5A7S432_9NOCA|nr:hypothetical protein [Spelaeibacter cavernicola]KAA0015739.1 hypothetical protein FOY51_26985 [Spelaeibacter cavernicola]